MLGNNESRSEPHRLLRCVAAVVAFVPNDAVDDLEVDGRQTGRLGIAEPGELKRGRSLGENSQSIAHCVPGQIDQDIDTVVGNQLAQLGCGFFRGRRASDRRAS